MARMDEGAVESKGQKIVEQAYEVVELVAGSGAGLGGAENPHGDVRDILQRILGLSVSVHTLKRTSGKSARRIPANRAPNSTVAL